MSKRKYSYYIVATEYGNSQKDNYKEAFSEYNRSESATLYGMPIGFYDLQIIMSK